MRLFPNSSTTSGQNHVKFVPMIRNFEPSSGASTQKGGIGSRIVVMVCVVIIFHADLLSTFVVNLLIFENTNLQLLIQI